MRRTLFAMIAASLLATPSVATAATITECGLGFLPTTVSCELPAGVGYDIRRDGGSAGPASGSGTGSSGGTNGSGPGGSESEGSEGPGQSDTKGGGKSQGKGADKGSNGKGHTK
jgi:hypothetical protein